MTVSLSKLGSSFTVTDKRSSATIRTVASFAKMTLEERARHLVYEHGFDAAQFDTTDALDALLHDNEGIVAAFMRAETDTAYFDQLRDAADGNSFPAAMTEWHEGDHNGDGTTVGGNYAESGLRDTVGLHIHQH